MPSKQQNVNPPSKKEPFHHPSLSLQAFNKSKSEESYLTKLYLTVTMMLHFPMIQMAGSVVIWGVLFYFSANVVRAILAIYFLNATVFSTSHLIGYHPPFWNHRKALRDHAHWRSSVQYFGGTLIKDCPETNTFDPSKNYLFNYHPHGLISIAAQFSLALNCCDFEGLFPGIYRSVATLNASFRFPFFREWVLMHGFISCNRKTLVTELTSGKSFSANEGDRKGIVRSVVLVPGGAQEALYSSPGTFRLHLKERKGFVKIGLETGCSLVPILGFGENDLFDTISNTSNTSISKALYSIQLYLTKKLSFSMPLITHFIPKRGMCTVVVGKPIDLSGMRVKVELGEVCDGKVIDEVHKRYCEELVALYEKYKDEYGNGVPIEIL